MEKDTTNFLEGFKKNSQETEKIRCTFKQTTFLLHQIFRSSANAESEYPLISHRIIFEEESNIFTNMRKQ